MGSRENEQDASSSSWSKRLKWLHSKTRLAAFGFFVTTEFLVPVVPLLRLHGLAWARLIGALSASLVACTFTTVLFRKSFRNAARFEEHIGTVAAKL
jgi:hypothetical protein